MFDVADLVVACVISALTAFLITPLVRKMALKLDVADKPDNKRKNHSGVTASLGGLAIFLGAVAGFLYLQPEHPQMIAIVIGACIMLGTGILDDLFVLSPYAKVAGQLAAAIVVVSSGLMIEKLTIPFFGTVYLDGLAYIITIIWILAASNAINLIDGLDGLAAGVSTIGLSSILVMAVIDYRLVVAYLCVILIGSCAGFLFHNFHPAKIFMGDTGALFLGYAIAVLSMLGLFKNVALFSFIIPFIVIAVPVLDTILAIIRRTINRQGISTADKQHIHYQLMKMGYSHRAAVLIIYGFSAFFGGMAIVFNSATMLTSVILFAVIIVALQMIVELAGIVTRGQRPILNRIKRILGQEKAK